MQHWQGRWSKKLLREIMKTLNTNSLSATTKTERPHAAAEVAMALDLYWFRAENV
jgi:hypothetical protein